MKKKMKVVRVPNVVIEGVTGNELITYFDILKLTHLNNSEEGKTDASVSALAEMADCSTKTIQRHIKSLAEKGFVKIERHNGKPSTFTLMDGFGNPFTNVIEYKTMPPKTEK